MVLVEVEVEMEVYSDIKKAETERLRCRLRIRNYISDTKILNPKYRYLFAYALILIVLYLEMFLHSSGYMLWWRLKLRWKWGVGWGSGKSTFPDTIIPMPIFLPKKLRPKGWGEGCGSGKIFLIPKCLTKMPIPSYLSTNSDSFWLGNISAQ